MTFRVAGSDSDRLYLILTHTAVAFEITAFFMWLGASCLHGLLASFLWLTAADVGEVKGRLKQQGLFVNDVASNMKAVGEALGSVWQLWHTAGATMLAGTLHFMTEKSI